MKKFLICLFLILGMSIYANNNISIEVKSNKVIATINLNKSEYIILNEQFLFLIVESEHYNFKFSGYPEGEVKDDGDVYYSGKVLLEGNLVLKDGIEPGEYNINVIFGYQTCDKEGICNIPVEVSEDIVVKNRSSVTPIIYILLFLSLSAMTILIIKRRKS